MSDIHDMVKLLPELRSFISPKVPGDVVDDVVNEVCLAVALNVDRWRGDSKFKTYVFAIARHKIYDFFRKEYKGKEGMLKLKEGIKEGIEDSEDKAFDVWMDNDLSRAEFAVFKLIGLGRLNSEIASELFISKDTVRTHIKHIYKKVGYSNRSKIVAMAQDFLKIQDSHKEWLEKFYNTYIQLGRKNNSLTGKMEEDAAKAKENLMKKLSR